MLVDKPARLLTSPDHYDHERPNLKLCSATSRRPVGAWRLPTSPTPIASTSGPAASSCSRTSRLVRWPTIQHREAGQDRLVTRSHREHLPRRCQTRASTRPGSIASIQNGKNPSRTSGVGASWITRCFCRPLTGRTSNPRPPPQPAPPVGGRTLRGHPLLT